MESSIKRLFIIGNGFDRAHNYAASYYDFRLWMENKLIQAFPNIKTDDSGHIILEESPEIPEVLLGNHGEEVPDEEKSLYLLMWLLVYYTELDFEWRQFEEALYSLDLESVISENDWFIEDNTRDKEGDVNPFWVASDYEDMANNVYSSVLLIQQLFAQWIEEVDIFTVSEYPVSAKTKALINNEALFLSFNYTETLEKVYGVPARNVDHIHGLRYKAMNYAPSDHVFPNALGRIIVGHGQDLARDFDDTYIEKENILQETIRALRKPVEQIVREHKAFWDFIHNENIRHVYSFGFGYGDVDKPYIRAIVRALDLPKNVENSEGVVHKNDDASKDVVWYLHKYGDTDGSNDRFEKQIRRCGFKGQFGRYE